MGVSRWEDMASFGMEGVREWSYSLRDKLKLFLAVYGLCKSQVIYKFKLEDICSFEVVSSGD